MKHNITYKIVLVALFAAITTMATLVIRIPIAGTSGYINIGDSIVIVSFGYLGGLYGGIAAGIGSMFADLIGGYMVYAPATLIIKFVMGLIGGIIFKKLSLSNKRKPHLLALLLSALVSEIIMVILYLGFESIILGLGKSALIPAISNIIQGAINTILGIILFIALSKFKIIKN